MEASVTGVSFKHPQLWTVSISKPGPVDTGNQIRHACAPPNTLLYHHVNNDCFLQSSSVLQISTSNCNEGVSVFLRNYLCIQSKDDLACPNLKYPKNLPFHRIGIPNNTLKTLLSMRSGSHRQIPVEDTWAHGERDSSDYAWRNRAT